MPFSYLTMLSHLELIKTVRLTGLGHCLGTWLFCLSKHHAVFPLPHTQFLGMCLEYKSAALHISVEQGQKHWNAAIPFSDFWSTEDYQDTGFILLLRPADSMCHCSFMQPTDVLNPSELIRRWVAPVCPQFRHQRKSWVDAEGISPVFSEGYPKQHKWSSPLVGFQDFSSDLGQVVWLVTEVPWVTANCHYVKMKFSSNRARRSSTDSWEWPKLRNFTPVKVWLWVCFGGATYRDRVSIP